MLLPAEQARLLAEVETFLQLLHFEQDRLSDLPASIEDAQAQVETDGVYTHSLEQLTYGSKVAWRNSTQCIGKFYWQQLQVRDLRHLSTPDEIFAQLVEHLRLANNGGRTRLLLSVFAPQQAGQPGIRVWNEQLVAYAGHLQPDGSVIGDPANVRFTQLVRALGWGGGAGTRFDVLPVVLQLPGRCPQLFELPPEAVLSVPIVHPEFAWFAELGLRWHSNPSISSSRLEIGGVSYTCAPFSAWYTGAEIGARNLSDAGRYNMLPEIARRMDLDTRHERSLWKDRALLELLRAVMHSFEVQRVTILDHHTVARQFTVHERREQEAGRIVPADWRAMVAPTSASATAIFERNYQNVTLKPNFFKQDPLWGDPDSGAVAPHGCPHPGVQLPSSAH